MYRILNMNNISQTEYEAYFALMSEEKKAKVKRFRFSEDKKRSICGEMLARKMISEECKIAPESIVFKTDENGKPYAENIDINFNISHSEDLVICALSKNPVGVDIEKTRDIKDKLINYVCTEKEKACVFEDSDRNKRFFEIWTAKEAYFKYLGTGITDVKSICTLDESFKKHLKTFQYENYIVSIYN